MDAQYRRQLSAVLNNIRRTIPGITSRVLSDGEWVSLKSQFFSDDRLFGRLNLLWHQIVHPTDHANFALIYCRSGLHPGVWLHHLATPVLRAEYLHGRHEIDSWT